MYSVEVAKNPFWWSWSKCRCNDTCSCSRGTSSVSLSTYRLSFRPLRSDIGELPPSTGGNGTYMTEPQYCRDLLWIPLNFCHRRIERTLVAANAEIQWYLIWRWRSCKLILCDVLSPKNVLTRFLLDYVKNEIQTVSRTKLRRTSKSIWKAKKIAILSFFYFLARFIFHPLKVQEVPVSNPGGNQKFLFLLFLFFSSLSTALISADSYSRVVGFKSLRESNILRLFFYLLFKPSNLKTYHLFLFSLHCNYSSKLVTSNLFLLMLCGLWAQWF